MNINTFEKQVNSWGKQRVPCFFCIDFEMDKPFACKLEEAHKYGFYWKINDKGNQDQLPAPSSEENMCSSIPLQTLPITFESFLKGFNIVKSGILRGDSYLCNLTYPTQIVNELDLQEIFLLSQEKYNLFKQGEFVLYSPESFIKIKGREINSFPMKGTIDLSVPNAEAVILADEKERREHFTIVDLIRNDLSKVAENVKVKRMRYTEKVSTRERELLQVSSCIQGELHESWHESLGTILRSLLPAGSISGAPKKSTVGLIKKAEIIARGYYCGVFGIYDGENLDSGVNIRYLERTEKGLRYRSGGGITSMSEVEQEYEELKSKVYVPVL